ncbi:MAG: SGNH/GDSL hydrolase family protein [Firmicutes bacterium]|nr:SGNH/GDSL hydrolase family protein [Bacillota bacterium]MBR7112897.1 SGNH/GDSL hydrolase family protein [Bacillota bacterium]
MRLREFALPKVDMSKVTPEMLKQYMAAAAQRIAALPGNTAEYDLASVEPNPASPLKGKKIIFLGSSVTLGQSSLNQSFADFLIKEDGVIGIKEAVNGTSMVDTDGMGPSFIKRIKNIDKDFAADAMIIQLSTNDATQNKPLGTISDSTDIDAFDTLTIAGAMEWLIAYSKQTWNCPVIFYTGTQYLSPLYGEMVELTKKLQEKWGIGLIDLWNDEEMLALDDETYDLYMGDAVHPTKAGYKLWWTPKFRSYLIDFFA